MISLGIHWILLLTTVILLSSCANDNANRERMLFAHQALANLSDSNRQQFGQLIEHLQAEIKKLSQEDETAE